MTEKDICLCSKAMPLVSKRTVLKSSLSFWLIDSGV